MLIEKLISDPSEDTIELLFEDDTEVFWVDWREDDAVLTEYCESIIKSNKLSSSLRDEKLFINYGDRTVEVPLTNSDADRHITLLSINETIYPDYEIRMVWDSNGGDTLAFTVLPTSKWNELESRYGEEPVEKAFLKLSPELNTFTDPLGKHRPGQTEGRRWWQFWK